ncbi:unnamed protein product [Durusdinium trenchii]|uniref:Uncharacterized protein n=3 Tax=Durusdinium trenchii TaxID=1381693 RepID=A0ABP0I035_9DINO
MLWDLGQVHGRTAWTSRGASENSEILQGKAQLLQILRRSRSREEWADAAAGLCLGQKMVASEYAKTIEEACCFRKLWEVALATLEDMREQGIPRNAPVYVAAIRSCGKSAWRHALSFLDDIQADRMEQGTASHKATLKVLEHAGRWKEVLAILKRMQQSGPTPGLEEYSLALRVCCNRSHRVVQELQASLDAVILGNQVEMCGPDEWQHVLELLQEFAAKKLVPDTVVYSSAIQILEKNCFWAYALQLLGEWRHGGHNSDTALYGTTIRCCLRDNRLEDAISLMKEAIKWELRPDTETYEALILDCSLAGHWNWAFFFLKDMIKDDRPVTSTVYESVLEACQVAGEWKWVLTVLSLFEEAMQPTKKAYSAALFACQEAQEWEWVKILQQKLTLREKVESAAEYGGQPLALAHLQAVQGDGDVKSTSVAAALQMSRSHTSSWQGALLFLRDLQRRRIRATAMAFNSVTDACRRGGEIQKALDLLEEMQQADFDPDVEIYNDLVSGLQPGKAKQTPPAIRQSWSMAPGSFRIVRSLPGSHSGHAKKRRQVPPP